MTSSSANVAPSSLRPGKAAADLFGDMDTNTYMVGSIGQLPQTQGFQLASGHLVPSCSASSTTRAMALFGELSDAEDVGNAVAGPSRSQSSPDEPDALKVPLARATPTTSHFFPQLSSTCPQGARSFIRPHPTVNFSVPRPTRDRTVLPDRPSTPSRTPLRSTTNTFAEHGMTDTPNKRNSPMSIEMKTPAATRRIGLGSTQTPGSARGPRRKGFITPFKKEVGLPSETVHVKLRTSAPGLSRSLPQAAQNEPVFDLSRESPHCCRLPDPMTL